MTYLMACYRPLTAWQLEDGTVVFRERGAILRELTLPCGRCVGCRLDRALEWSLRCMHEAQLHEFSSFVTLTYEDDPISLRYRDFQLFMKRLRKAHGPVRFFMAGEYGEQLGRPHFHALLFGIFFADRSVFSQSGANTLYRSPELERLWPHGHSSIGDVTMESAGYVARYSLKKVTGSQAEQHYVRFHPYTGELVPVVPEFSRMSLRPGIGYGFYERYRSDMTGEKHDGVVLAGGRRVSTPKYYDKVLERNNPEMFDNIKQLRYDNREASVDDSSDRLAVREYVQQAALANKLRKL